MYLVRDVLYIPRFGESAFAAMALFCGYLTTLTLLATWRLPRRLPCSARLRLYARTAPQANGMRPEFPAVSAIRQEMGPHNAVGGALRAVSSLAAESITMLSLCQVCAKKITES